MKECNINKVAVSVLPRASSPGGSFGHRGVAHQIRSEKNTEGRSLAGKPYTVHTNDVAVVHFDHPL